MKLILSAYKSVEENAQTYFEKAKKSKKKLDGALIALEHWKQQKQKLLTQQEAAFAATKQKPVKYDVPSHWYHKFRWFFTSDGFLVVGGRDATTNEIIIKKHTQAQDLVFHTDMAGSPFFVIKSDGKTISKTAIRETADATCTFSRAFQLGIGTQSVFYVKPDQVTKEAQSGEYLTKGAFMIRGKTNYTENKINLAVGITKDHEVMAGPFEAVSVYCKPVVVLRSGKEKVSNTAKKLSRMLSYHDLDTLIRVLPAGSFEISS